MIEHLKSLDRPSSTQESPEKLQELPGAPRRAPGAPMSTLAALLLRVSFLFQFLFKSDEVLSYMSCFFLCHFSLIFSQCMEMDRELYHTHTFAEYFL